MLSSFAVVSSQGIPILTKDFRAENTELALKEFCDTVIRPRVANETPPFVRLKDVTVAFIKSGGVFLVATTIWDTNGALLLEMLHAIAAGFQHYLRQTELKQDDITSHLSMLYVLVDEMVEYGYPQIMSIEVLGRYLGDTGILPKVERNMVSSMSLRREKQPLPSAHTVTLDVTGAVPWRKQGIHYRTNEVWMDIAETVNATIMPNGEYAAADVVGAIKMKCQLSGAPECKVGLNDKLSLQIVDPTRAKDLQISQDQAGEAAGGGVILEGVSLHQCVRLSDFESKREISFVPPDGEFKLITYRMSDNIMLPFKLSTTFKQHGRLRMEVEVTLTCLYEKRLAAYLVRVFVPVPASTTKVSSKATGGKCRTDLAAGHIRWKFKELEGGQAHSMRADVTLISTTNTEKEWEKPPVKVTFDLPGFAASGLRVRFFHIHERSGYTTNKWVRYETSGGNYEARLP